jgi:hypothetical protein
MSNTNIPTTVPAGYMQDAKGRLVPESQVKPVDLLRDQLVRDLASQAKNLSDVLATFKRLAFADIAAFIETSAEQYGAKLGGTKGNLVLYTYDGHYKIERRFADNITFDERLMAAKALIDECITEWSQGSREEIKTLINDAFRVDQQGQVSTSRVLGLRRLHITNDTWSRAMEAISDSVQVVGSSGYVRVYERVGDSDQYRQIPLDLAAV